MPVVKKKPKKLKKINVKLNIDLDDFIAKANKTHADRYDYSHLTKIPTKQRIMLHCKKHGRFKVRAFLHLTGSGCKRCGTSKGENIIAAFLTNNHIPFSPEHSFEGYSYRYDFYVPKANLLIEHHGEQHYRPVKKFGGKRTFLAGQARDKHKVQIAKEKGINLLVVNYQDLAKGTVTSKIRAYLKRYYQFWYLIDGKLVVMRNILDLGNYYDIPKNLPLKEYEKYVSEKYPNFKILLA